ncbi:MAG: hypothetical protein AAF549_04610 [Pseudomonadota bacterium]
MKRRTFLGLSTLALSAGFGAPWAYNAHIKDVCEDDIDPNRVNSLLGRAHYNEADFWPQAYGLKQYTMVGDTNHLEPRIEFFFLSLKNIEYMQAAGVQNIFMEGLSSTLDRIERSIARGDVQPAQEEYDFSGLSYDQRRALYAQALTSFYHECTQRGMQVHYVDNADEAISEDVLERFQEYSSDLQRDFVQRCGSDTGPTINAYISFAFRNPLQTLRTNYWDRDEFASRDDDRIIASRIQSRASAEGNVIFYGAWHFARHDFSLASLLGRDNAFVVNMYGDAQHFIQDRAIGERSDYAYLAEEGRAMNITGTYQLEASARPHSRALSYSHS